MKERIKTMLDYAHFEGKIVPADEAKISLAGHVIQYGTGVFGGMRGYVIDKNTVRLFRINEHYERLMRATKIFGMKFELTFEEFQQNLLDLMKANKPETGFYIRPIIYSDDEVLTPCFHKLSFKIGYYMISLGDYLDTTRGLRLMVSSYKKFSDASISTKAKATGAYLHASAARSEADRCGYDEALVMDDNWHIVEGSAANLMIVYRDKVVVPDRGCAMLEGITMRSMLDLLRDSGYFVKSGIIDRSILYSAEEVMLTGTGAQVVWAQSVDDRTIGTGKIGKVAAFLQQQYADLIAMKHSRSKDWVYEFKI
jgi:branched-chain amino acid aminotransferase